MPAKNKTPTPFRVSTSGGQRTRLTPEREAELFTVVVQMLREVGYASMTMPAVAARTRCSTATLYRQWKGKAGLVVAAMQHAVPAPEMGRDIDTGSLRGDLVELARRMSKIAPTQHELMVGVGHAALRNPELATTMREQLSPPDRLHEILERAVARGEVVSDTPAREFCELMMVSVHLTRPIVEGRQADQAYLVRLVDAVVLPALQYRSEPPRVDAARLP